MCLASTGPGKEHPHTSLCHRSAPVILHKEASPSSLTDALNPHLHQVETCGLLHLAPTSKPVPTAQARAGRVCKGQLFFNISKRTEGILRIMYVTSLWLVERRSPSGAQSPACDPSSALVV